MHGPPQRPARPCAADGRRSPHGAPPPPVPRSGPPEPPQGRARGAPRSGAGRTGAPRPPRKARPRRPPASREEAQPSRHLVDDRNGAVEAVADQNSVVAHDDAATIASRAPALPEALRPPPRNPRRRRRRSLLPRQARPRGRRASGGSLPRTPPRKASRWPAVRRLRGRDRPPRAGRARRARSPRDGAPRAAAGAGARRAAARPGDELGDTLRARPRPFRACGRAAEDEPPVGLAARLEAGDRNLCRRVPDVDAGDEHAAVRRRPARPGPRRRSGRRRRRTCASSTRRRA